MKQTPYKADSNDSAVTYWIIMHYPRSQFLVKNVVKEFKGPKKTVSFVYYRKSYLSEVSFTVPRILLVSFRRVLSW